MGLDDAPRWRRWARRLVTVPAALAAAAAGWALAPLWLLLALGRDLLGRHRGAPTTRLLAATLWYLAFEVLGLVGALGVWTWAGGGLHRRRLERAGAALQRWWSGCLFAGLRHIYGLRVEIDGPIDAAGDRPFLLLMRHVSMVDTLLPAVAWANARRLRLRYVLKAELCAVPTLDLVGHWLPNAFVRRGGADPTREVARILRLHEGMGAREGLVLFPEGTRFSPGRRQRLIDRLATRGDAARAARAAAFTRVLPPHPGGPVALLGRRKPGEDVVLCAHTGLEGVLGIAAALDGRLIGRTLRLKVWHVPGEQVPRDPAAALAWLDDRWREVDAWVGRHEGGQPAAEGPSGAQTTTPASG